MGDIDSVSGVHIVQLEKRQLKIEKFKYFFLGGGGNETHLSVFHSVSNSGGQSTQIKHLSKSTDMYYKI